MLKKILIALVALLAVLVIIVALQPSEFRVSRTTKIFAPAGAVFAQVNDFHKWAAWSPWAKLDPAAKISFAGPDEGEGAVLSWGGNDKVGEGRMTLTKSRPSERIVIKTDFVKPFKGTNMTAFSFKPEDDRTAVEWIMTGHHNFLEKAFCLVMNGKKMVGDDLDKGLANLKAVAEAAPKP
jgi:hypothetical protein